MKLAINLSLTIVEASALEHAIADSALEFGLKDYICTRLKKEQLDWSIDQSKRLIGNIASELSADAPFANNMKIARSLQNELNLLVKSLEARVKASETVHDNGSLMRHLITRRNSFE